MTAFVWRFHSAQGSGIVLVLLKTASLEKPPPPLPVPMPRRGARVAFVARHSPNGHDLRTAAALGRGSRERLLDRAETCFAQLFTPRGDAETKNMVRLNRCMSGGAFRSNNARTSARFCLASGLHEPEQRNR